MYAWLKWLWCFKVFTLNVLVYVRAYVFEWSIELLYQVSLVNLLFYTKSRTRLNTNEEQVPMKMQLRTKLELEWECKWKELRNKDIFILRIDWWSWRCVGFPTYYISSGGRASNLWYVLNLKTLFEERLSQILYAIHAWNCGLDHFKRFTWINANHMQNKEKNNQFQFWFRARCV